MHPRKMRIESHKSYSHEFCHLVSRCILAKWGLKDNLRHAKHGDVLGFKMHPRKMRIERQTGRQNEMLEMPFQDASSQNEDWKRPDLLQQIRHQFVSRCILAKWGLKVWRCFGRNCWFVVSRCILAKWGLKEWSPHRGERKPNRFKMHPRKMRIERISSGTYLPLQQVSRCILAKWGLKELYSAVASCSEICFKMHPRKMRIERLICGLLQSVGLQFQDASSQNEDWKGCRKDDKKLILSVSRCILAKWGLKGSQSRT